MLHSPYPTPTFLVSAITSLTSFLLSSPSFGWRRRKNLYILSGNKIFLHPLPFFTIFSAMVWSSTSCISSESQPPFTQPAFHPLVLKSWILSGLDLTYSFLFPCTSITFLKSRKGLGVTLILRRRDKGSVLLRLQVLSYRCKTLLPRLDRVHVGWQES
jgi:hypothetical protein